MNNKKKHTKDSLGNVTTNLTNNKLANVSNHHQPPPTTITTTIATTTTTTPKTNKQKNKHSHPQC